MDKVQTGCSTGVKQMMRETGDYYKAEGAYIIGDVTIGTNVGIWYNAVIRGDEDSILIGDNTNIQDNCTIHTDPGYQVVIGSGVTVGHGCIIHGAAIGDNTLVGMGSIVMNGVTVGQNCLIGAGSLLVGGMEVPDNSLVLGSPARIVRELSEQEIQANRDSAAAYVRHIPCSTLSVDRAHVKAQFDEYAGRYDLSDVKIKLKWEHTCYVAQHCDRIARSLSLPEADVDLAWLLGMFHDIGRFEQVRRYHTFQDKVSVNHAELSADLLFTEGLVDSFLPEQSRTLYRLMDTAIRYHNRYRLPEDLSERERLFANILRDADKVDILRVNCQTPRTEIYDLPEEAFRESDMTDEVYAAVSSCREVDRQYSRTGIDFIMGHVGFVYGLVFPESRKIIAEQGYLEQLLQIESTNPRTRERLAVVRETVKRYISEI